MNITQLAIAINTTWSHVVANTLPLFDNLTPHYLATLGFVLSIGKKSCDKYDLINDTHYTLYDAKLGITAGKLNS